MYKILLVGKMNTITQGVNDYLNRFFSVQYCMDDAEMVKEMLEMKKPDLIFVCLSRLEESGKAVMEEIKDNYSDIPVACLGLEMEQNFFADYLKTEQFHPLTRPIENGRILDGICKILNLRFDMEIGEIVDASHDKKKILLIDDSVIQLRVINEMLKETYDVQMATSAPKALHMMGKVLPDVIFLDYEMPVYDGKMAFEMIREIDEAKNIPIVFLTGVKDVGHISAVLSLKPEGYLLKPASAESIFEELDKIFGNNKNERG